MDRTAPPETPPEAKEEEAVVDPPHDYDTVKYKQVVELINAHRYLHIRRAREDNYARFVVNEARQVEPRLNLMNDSVLHEVIARRKTLLAVAIIDTLEPNEHGMFRHKNFYGDTPLHIAAMKGDSAVAEALLEKDKKLAGERNRKGETPLHKAVQYGHFDVFRRIIVFVSDKSMPRTDDGSTILHYAIMSDQPKEALYIARQFKDTIQSRNAAGATPLQIMVAFFKKPSENGFFKSLLYKYINSRKATRTRAVIIDEESGDSIQNENTAEADGNRRSGLLGWWRNIWIVKNIIGIRTTIEKLRDEKSKYESTMELLEFLAQPSDDKKPSESFEFYFRGFTAIDKGPKMQAPDAAGDGESFHIPELPAEGINTTSIRDDDVSSNTNSDRPPAKTGIAAAADGKEKITLLRRLADELISSTMSRPAGSAKQAGGSAAIQELVKSASRALEEVANAKDRKIWEESPLITGVKLGLDDFVIKILNVCPQSATYVGYDGMNVLQAAVKYDRRQVVKAIKEDDRLPSWLFTELESDTKNTLLHIAAADKNIQKKANPLRLQDELEGFEMLEEMVPKELLNYRNRGEKTAREVFDEKHEETVKVCRAELADIGKACSPLVAAVVFTSSFYIPSEINRDSSRLAFKIFSHVYVLAFSCAATSLVMFLLLVVTPFKQRDFRRVVPWHYLLACFLLAMSLAAFIVAFACNMYLQIYGGRKSPADLVTLLLELLLVPFLCAMALVLAGASWRFGSVIGRLTK